MIKESNKDLIKNYNEAVNQGMRALHTGRKLEKMINQRIKLDNCKSLSDIEKQNKKPNHF